MVMCSLVFIVTKLWISCSFILNVFYAIAMSEYQLLYQMVNVQSELLSFEMKNCKILRATVLESVVKPSLCKAPLRLYHHGND